MDACPDIRPEIVWAALDCPSGWAVDEFQREGVLLGRMAAVIRTLPVSGEAHVITGWRIGEDGRKRLAGSALYSAGGDSSRRPARPGSSLLRKEIPLRGHDEVAGRALAGRTA